jgi:hypothetical protein
MALDKAGYISGLIALFTDMEENERDKTYYANQFATLTETFVKSGTVSVVTSTPGAQEGTSTLPGTGTGSVT